MYEVKKYINIFVKKVNMIKEQQIKWFDRKLIIKL